MTERYEILETIGSGGSGIVYKVYDKALDKTLAIKVLIADAGENFIRRFQNEARALAQLDHQNLVRAIDFGVGHEGRPYLVMEYVEGEALSSFLEHNHKLTLDQFFIIMPQICTGLSHAHARGVWHRDIKPANIMLGAAEEFVDKQVKILDLGTAKWQGRDQKLTASGAGVGTVLYMSPEQARGDEIDARADIYALGCVMFEALAGRTPFVAASAIEVVAKKCTQRAPLLSELVSDADFPPALEALVAKCLETRAQDRFTTVDQISRELAEIGDELLLKKSQIKEDGDRGNVSHLIEKRTPLPIPFVCAAAIVLLALTVVLINHNGERISGWFYSAPSPASRVDPIVTQTALQPLPPDEAVAIQYGPRNGRCDINFATDDDLERFAKHMPPWVHTLSLGFSEAQGRGLDSLIPLSLTEFESDVSVFDNKQLLQALGRMRHLKRIKLLRNNPGLSDEYISELSNLRGLNELILGECKFSAQGFKTLSGMTSLERMNLRNVELTDPASLGYLTNVRILGLEGENYVPANIRALAHCPQLQVLMLEHIKDDVVPDMVSSCLLIPNLEQLSLVDLSLPGRDLLLLRAHKSLNDLNLVRVNGITASDLGLLAKFDNLKTLRIDEFPHADKKAYLPLADCPNLNLLEIRIKSGKLNGLATLLNARRGNRAIKVNFARPD